MLQLQTRTFTWRQPAMVFLMFALQPAAKFSLSREQSQILRWLSRSGYMCLTQPMKNLYLCPSDCEFPFPIAWLSAKRVSQTDSNYSKNTGK